MSQQTGKSKISFGVTSDNYLQMVFEDQDDTISMGRSSVDITSTRHRSNIISNNSPVIDCQTNENQEEKKSTIMQKKHSQPFKLMVQKQQKPKQQTKSQVLPQKSISFTSTRTTSFINPFQPRILSLPTLTKTNRLLLIFISVQPIKSIEITSIHLIQRKVKHIANIYSFADTHFVLATFEVSHKEQYGCCVTYEDESLTRHQIIKSQPFQGICLTIIVRASLSIQQKRKSLNFAIFQSISFLLDNVVSKTHTIQKQLFPWFNQLYYHFCRVSDKSTSQILTNLQINKKQPKNSQYFLYFFKAVYKQQALQLYQHHRIQQKMTFSFVCRIVNKNYPQSQELCNFYIQVNLIFAINHYYIYSSEELKNLVYFNIGCQTPDKINQLLMRLGVAMPKCLVDFDEDIKTTFMEENTLTMVEYIVLRVKYFPFMVEKKPASQQAKFMMMFIKDLMEVAVTRPEDQFQHDKKVFERSFLCQLQRILRLPQLDLPRFYSKCKILKSFTRDTINLVDITLQILQERQASLIKHYPIKMVLSLLILPTSQFDLQQLNRIFSQKLMTTSEWVQVIRQLVVTDRNAYNIQYIQQKFIEIYKEIDVIAIAESLDKAMVSVRQKKTKTNQTKCSLISRLFMIFTSQTKVSNCLTLKKLLDSCCILRDPFLKQAFLNKIFKEIQRNNSSEEYLLFVEKQVSNFDAEYRVKCLSYLATCRDSHRQ